jgi:catechol 2,3-dioxygenase-like lactoylglutathione lyase family enzyme
MNFSFVLLYVQNPPASARFYADLLGTPPIENSPTFAMLPLSEGVMLGLWLQKNVEPKAALAGGGGEVAFTVGDDKTVDAMHKDWKKRGIEIQQPPTRMDFGYTFVAADPDGHRLRVFARPSA